MLRIKDSHEISPRQEIYTISLWVRQHCGGGSRKMKEEKSELPSSQGDTAMGKTTPHLCILALGPQHCVFLSVIYGEWRVVSEYLTMYCWSFGNEEILEEGVSPLDKPNWSVEDRVL